MCVTNNLGPKKQVGSKQLINLLSSMCVILRRRQTDIKNNLFTIHNILCHNRQLGRKTHQIVQKNISRNAKQRLLIKKYITQERSNRQPKNLLICCLERPIIALPLWPTNKFCGQWLCGSVGRAVASNTRGPWFESSHWQN